jgi:two-component system chemotaxis response regulator CheB
VIFGVLVVDDSDLTREALRRALEADPRLKVVGEARSGEEAVELARRLRPQLITMDLAMPGIGGLKAIELIMHERPVPLVVISEKAASPGQDLNYEAISRGAIELVPKSAVFGGNHRFADQMRQLAEAGLAISGPSGHAIKSSRPPTAEPPLLVGLGASTGGPRALAQLLGALSPTFPVPIAIVQHMATDFYDSFITFLSDRSGVPVVKAEQGMQASAGKVYVAPAHRHLTINSALTFRLSPAADEADHCPSVDVLFKSMAQSLSGRALGVLMTGMGADGAEGLLALKRSGARTAVQDAPSCAVAGMPQAALKLDAAEDVVALSRLAEYLIGETRGARPKDGSRKRILIVDDSPLLLEATKLALEDSGYEVQTLENPLIVAMVLRKNPADLVLVDVNMPAVKGTQVVAALRSHGLTSTPVILYSDLSEATLEAKANECGATGWLRKTGDEEELVRAICGWIGEGRR